MLQKLTATPLLFFFYRRKCCLSVCLWDTHDPASELWTELYCNCQLGWLESLQLNYMWSLWLKYTPHHLFFFNFIFFLLGTYIKLTMGCILCIDFLILHWDWNVNSRDSKVLIVDLSQGLEMCLAYSKFPTNRCWMHESWFTWALCLGPTALLLCSSCQG
jgi:hypothetical protein